MSKSDPSDYSRINLTDDADAIAQKIRKAKTDPEKGLESAAAALADKTRRRCATFKNALVDLSVAKLGPIGGEMKRSCKYICLSASVLFATITIGEEGQQWLGVGDLMREEAREEADGRLDHYAARARNLAGVDPGAGAARGDQGRRNRQIYR
jgi:hypothetical protein